MRFTFDSIGTIHSCFKEKFGIPRQPGLAPASRASLELLPPYNQKEALVGLEKFSHLWVLFVFHHNLEQSWRPTVRPPRLGGNQRLGVFATRSGFRPNPIGLSVVELIGVDSAGPSPLLHLKGGDFVDGTPVIDIKPYIPYADSLPEAFGGFADRAPLSTLEVVFSPEAERQLAQRAIPDLKSLICQVIGQDPRPAYRSGSDDRCYGVALYDCNVRWCIQDGKALVLSLVQPDDPEKGTNR